VPGLRAIKKKKKDTYCRLDTKRRPGLPPDHRGLCLIARRESYRSGRPGGDIGTCVGLGLQRMRSSGLSFQEQVWNQGGPGGGVGGGGRGGGGGGGGCFFVGFGFGEGRVAARRAHRESNCGARGGLTARTG